MARFFRPDQIYERPIAAHGHPRKRIYSNHVEIIAGRYERLAHGSIITKDASVRIADLSTHVSRFLRARHRC